MFAQVSPQAPTIGRAFPVLAPIVGIGTETPSDMPAREALLDRAMGTGRRRKSSEALRRGRLPAEGLSLCAKDEAGRLVGTVRLWHIAAGDGDAPSLLLGPLAVCPEVEGLGIGATLMRRAIAEAQWRGHRSIVLVGDPGYYSRFGFSSAPAAGLWMPGPFERHRLLAREIEAGALGGTSGLIRPKGRRLPKSADAGNGPDHALSFGGKQAFKALT